MIIVKHRQNELKNIKKLNFLYGAEIDIRSNSKTLITQHDPLKNGVTLDVWLQNYKHNYLIANIKEEGIETKVISLLKKYKIKNYFLLDVTIPMINKLNSIKIYNIALRISKFESLNNIKMFNKQNKWIWIDTFNKKIPINYTQIMKLKKMRFKLCLVSPELIYNKKSSISSFYKKNKRIINMMDMICTKFPEYWQGKN
jgi:hypothetical protein